MIVLILSSILLSQARRYRLTVPEKRLLVALIVFDAIAQFYRVPGLLLLPAFIGIVSLSQTRVWDSLRDKERVMVNVLFGFTILEVVVASLYSLFFISLRDKNRKQFLEMFVSGYKKNPHRKTKSDRK